MKYKIWNTKENKFVGGEYSTLSRACNRADKLDLVYGAAIHAVRGV